MPNWTNPGPYSLTYPTLQPPLTVRPGDVISYGSQLPGLVSTGNNPTTPPVDSLTRITLTGYLTDGTNPQVGPIRFRQVLVDSGNNIQVTGAEYSAATSGGHFSIPLPGTDDPATALPGFAWLVIEPSGYQYLIKLPIASPGGTLDIADAPRVGSDRSAVTVDGAHVDTLAITSTPVGVGDLAGVSQANAAVGGVLTASTVTGSGSGTQVTGWQVTAQPPPPPTPSGSARYLFPVSPNSTSTSAALTNGTLRLAPWYLPAALTIDRIGGDISVVGDSGSKLRPAIYADNGHCYPGALLLDPGTIAADSATVQDVAGYTGPLTIPAGVVWIGGAVQLVTTTQPTVRINNNWTPPVPILLATGLPAAGATGVGYSQTGVTGALPSNFTSSVSVSGSVPRIHVRLA